MGLKKIIHISHCGRLFTLATFISYIYKENHIDSDFEFYYLENKSKSYRGYSSFKVAQRDVPLPIGVGNMRNARIDSAFFSQPQQIGLKIKAQEYVIKCLMTIPPTKRRIYPFIEK